MSTAELAIRWFKGVLLVALAVWELGRLARRPADRPLRVLAPGLVALAFAATVGIRTPLLDPVEDFFGRCWPYVINGAWSVMAYAFAAYFLLANPWTSRARRTRKALVELGVLVAALAAMVLVRELAPETWQRPMSVEQRRSLPNVVWYLVVDGYALTAWFVGVRRARTVHRHVRNSWARVSLWAVIVGSAGMALGVNAVSLIKQAIRAVEPDAELGALSAVYSTGQLGGQLVLASGLALVPLATAVAALRARGEHRLRERYARRLRPLWQVLTAEFPHVAVEHTSSRAFDRYTAEITDGLAELARDCPNPTADMRGYDAAASVVAAGLQHRAARLAGDGVAEPAPPYPRIEPDFDSWRERARWMIALGERVQQRPTTEVGRGARA